MNYDNYKKSRLDISLEISCHKEKRDLNSRNDYLCLYLNWCFWVLFNSCTD